jgi:hypothetical protein
VELPLQLLGTGFGEWQRARFLLPLESSASFLRKDHVASFGGSLLRRFGESGEDRRDAGVEPPATATRLAWPTTGSSTACRLRSVP